MTTMFARRSAPRLLLFILIALCHRAFWHLASSIAPSAPSSLRNKSILLLIAHPDDESMFFSPTIQALTSPSLANRLKILCLSTGNSTGLGEVRRKELKAAAVTLGVRRPQDVIVVDDENRFRDDMKLRWSDEEIADVLRANFMPQPNMTSPTPWSSIDVLLTFDSSGISLHPNHVSLYYGAQYYLSDLKRNCPFHSCPVDLYTLTTVSFLRHYDYVLDIIPTLTSKFIGSWWENLAQPTTASSQEKVIFVAGPSQYWNARNAMMKGHRSQSVWFRWPWINIGRYMVVNHLRREQVPTASV